MVFNADKYKIQTKIISFLIAQVFLVTSLGYPSDIKATYSLYTPAKAGLRKPLDSSNSYKRGNNFKYAYALISYMQGMGADNIEEMLRQIQYYLEEYCYKSRHWKADVATNSPQVRDFFQTNNISDKNEQSEILNIAKEILQIQYASKGRGAVVDFINTHRDVFIDFDQAKEEVKRLISEKEDFSVVLFDGDAIKRRNEAFGQDIVDWEIFEMVEAFYEIVQSLGKVITMKAFRRGGDEFGFVIPSSAINKEELKTLLELVRISLPTRIKSRYGLLVVNEPVEKDMEILDGLKRNGEIKEFEKVGRVINILCNRDRDGRIKGIREVIGREGAIEEVGDEFILTGSIGAVYVGREMRGHIETKVKEVDLNSIMAGANYALSRAKEVGIEPGEQERRKKGNRIYIIDDQRPDIDKWFHDDKGVVSSIFKDQETQKRIEGSFNSSSISDEDKRDKQIPIVYTEAALRNMMSPNNGVLIAIDVLWQYQKFVSLLKGQSYLKDFFAFSALNEALPMKMHDADWALKILGYVQAEKGEAIFGKGSAWHMARAPPGKSPDRFYVLLEKGDVIIQQLKTMIRDIANEIQDNTVLKVSVHITVVPVQEDAGSTFGIIDGLSNLYIDYGEKNNSTVFDRFSNASLKEGENVYIVEDLHSIVLYNSDEEQQFKIKMAEFSELKRQAALSSLRDSLPRPEEDYSKTIKRLDKDNIPPGIRKIINSIRTRLDL